MSIGSRPPNPKKPRKERLAFFGTLDKLDIAVYNGIRESMLSRSGGSE